MWWAMCMSSLSCERGLCWIYSAYHGDEGNGGSHSLICFWSHSNCFQWPVTGCIAGVANSQHAMEGSRACVCGWRHLQWWPLASTEHSAVVAMVTAVLGQGWLAKLQELDQYPSPVSSCCWCSHTSAVWCHPRQNLGGRSDLFYFLFFCMSFP